MIANTLPKSLIDNPRLNRWLDFAAPGRTAVRVGKVEIGQGIATALAQIAAEELDVDFDQIDLTSGDTDVAPDEGMTSGSLSIEVGGASLRLVCAEARTIALTAAAARLGCSVVALDIEDGAILQDGVPSGLDYWNLSLDLNRFATGAAPPKPASAYRVVGQNIARRDLPAKIFGAGFVQDFTRPGMRHGHVVHAPRMGMEISALDLGAIQRAAGGAVEILRHGQMLALLSDNMTALRRAADAADRAVAWDGLAPLTQDQQEAAWLVRQPSLDGAHGDVSRPPAGTTISATYSRPYISHGSIGPSCAVAEFADGHLTVWCHVQGVYPLQSAIAGGLKLDPARVSVRHLHGSGCYGHNGADDAAYDAAAIALLRPETPIRVQWRREDEFSHEPVGTAMMVRLEGIVGPDGALRDLTTHIWSGPHTGRGGAGNALSARSQPNPVAPSPVSETSAPTPGAGTRNAIPNYAIPAMRYRHHLVPETPVRTSALRGLGAMPNIFALESFLDECANAAGEDPLAYRLAMQPDPRARDVLTTVAEMAGWSARGPAGTGSGLGLGFGRYKNASGYAAVAVRVSVDTEIRLVEIWCAADGGLAINPNGVIAQLEGGIIQGASWALKEQVQFDAAGVASRNWDRYPILRFSEIPPITCQLLNRPNDPSLGMGEATIGPIAAAIGNAASHALGARLRDLPLTRSRVIEAVGKS